MKFFIPAFLVFFISPGATAQSEFKKEFQLGVSQGIVLSRVDFNPHVDQQLIQGYAGGLIFRYISEPQLGLQLEVNYLQKGWNEDLGDYGTYSRQLDMLEVPFLTHFYAGKETRLRFQFILGPYVGYFLRTSEKIAVTDTFYYNDYYNKLISRKMEIGYLAGISFSYRTKLGIFELQGAYRHSLMNLFEAGDEAFVYNGSRPQSIGITVHYLVRFGKR